MSGIRDTDVVELPWDMTGVLCNLLHDRINSLLALVEDSSYMPIDRTMSISKLAFLVLTTRSRESCLYEVISVAKALRLWEETSKRLLSAVFKRSSRRKDEDRTTG